MNTCGLWSVVTSWIKSFPGMSSTLQLFRTIPETCPKNNNCATFCWNEMFYQEIRQMSQLPPKSRWWGMGPMKRITTIWLESRKSLFAKKKTLNPNLRTRESTRWELQEEPLRLRQWNKTTVRHVTTCPCDEIGVQNYLLCRNPELEF